MGNKIRISNLIKIFGKHPEKALKMLDAGMSKDEIFKKTKQSVGVADVSFDVAEGEILVIMGLSGSGKSTLVRCINRLIEPTRGKVYVDGQDITTLTPLELRMVRQQKFGMVFQNFALFPHRTVLQNTGYGLEVKGMEKSIRHKKAMESLELVGLAGWENSYPSQLSGGMQQRVGLARALALDPDILLMDEAFSALDPLIRKNMQDELLDLQERVQKTIVFISHDLDEALKLGDRIILMKDGQIVQAGTPEDILTNPATDYVARFVADVDISKVLTAESIMKKSKAVGNLKNDGPRTALRKMEQADISSLFIVKKDNTLRGIISAEDAAIALKANNHDLEKILRSDITTVPPDTPASDLVDIMKDLPYPLAVVSDGNKLIGVIVRGTLLAALANGGRS
ncbi:MAG: glycine betaine/L-proline ABC transporter ATP-binding protein [Desulfobacterales bacterium]|nr:glycine betaine/L-proline ABC transporter ATP-binding protein [Desulfobacterales bacterium]MDD4391748.1 glycine betaine/L-proline ABC transporter ATP-binding protein [Desulfobacterales bacterium]